MYYNEIKNLLDKKSKVNLGYVNEVLMKKYNFNLRKYGYKRITHFINQNFNDKLKLIRGRDKQTMFVICK